MLYIQLQEIHIGRKSFYPYYTTVLLQDIEFPVNQIKKFERANDITINVYYKHVNLFYVQDSLDDNVKHFAWIRNLSRLVSSQLSNHNDQKYICDRCLHYFASGNKLQLHTVDCREINE
ncbi:hypothetical protein ACFW04_013933 [Cataglyphis niger]